MTVSVVTGASTGIGFATALRLAREGHRVHGSVRSEASGQALLEAAGDLDLSLVVMDVDDDESVTAALGALVAETGGVDVLVNNAGITGGHAVEETSMAQFQAVMNTNAWGTLRCIQAVLPSMRARGSGRIVNVTSVAGRLAMSPQGAYAMSKFATEALTEILAMELAPFGIHVSAVEPGVVATPIFEKAMADLPDPASPYQANRRMGEWFLQALLGGPSSPDDAAAVIWEAVSAESPRLRYTVGEDARRTLEYRASVGDEEWVARNGEPDEAAWRRWISGVSGVPMPD